MAKANVLPKEMNGATVQEYVDFDGEGKARLSKQATLQSEAVAGLWGLLRKRGFAYLGDEVGTGKTRQAMGVIATQFLQKPSSRVVILCSDKEMQGQWCSEWSFFLRACYRLKGCALKPAGRNPMPFLRHENLASLACALSSSKEPAIHVLRYSSFSWPYAKGGKSPKAMLESYAKCFNLVVDDLDKRERQLAGQWAHQQEGWDAEMSHVLAEQFCRRLGDLLDRDGGVDLLVCDEAQYLRRLDNERNRRIGDIFRQRAKQWLFMSATPLHSGVGDLASLDYYLCSQDLSKKELPYPSQCQSCSAKNRCSRVTARLKREDVVQVLSGMMIRRPRAYLDGAGNRHGKRSYRHYQERPIAAASDPFLSLTMALVQKRIVAALQGRPGQVKNGALVSFESASVSLQRKRMQTATAADEQIDLEPVQDGRHESEGGHARDRNAIDRLNLGFQRAMDTKDSLPHAKLLHVVDALYERSLAHGSTDKTLVFVRRLDSVEEIRDMLHSRFQRDIDARVIEWRRWLRVQGAGSLWARDGFWTAIPEDRHASGASDNDLLEMEAEGAQSSHYRQGEELPFFVARRQQTTGESRALPPLARFRTYLLRKEEEQRSGPMRGFLLKPVGEAGNRTTEANHLRWHKLLQAVFSTSELEQLLKAQPWLAGCTLGESDQAYRLACLQLCILRSMRESDFLVDLYIMHFYDKSAQRVHDELPERLLWLLQNGEASDYPHIAAVVRRQRDTIRNWVMHFDLIVDKCLRDSDKVEQGWKDTYDNRIKLAFQQLEPVTGRSGRLDNKHAVQQFKFPGFPNIMVCTDVLKQGVDLHLFCNAVVHYGIAWTAGDLEQRIGRVDRLGGLLSRRLFAHTGSAAQAPRLAVQFPYLDGTLDKRQVRNVLYRKILSDLTLDLQKPAKEADHISADNLGQHLNVVVPNGKLGSETVFFPDEVKFARDRTKQALNLPKGVG